MERRAVKILYEDNHLLVAVKEPYILSQSDGSKTPDMLTILKQYLKVKYNKPGNVYLGLVHRLDKEVGGVMVFAKTSKAASRLSEQIRLHKTEKYYLAVVNGKVESTTYKDKYDKEVLTHEKGEKYKIIKFRENGYDAYLAVIYDPSKIKVVTSKYLGYNGQYLTDMAKENNALVAINGSGFLDPDGVGTGGLVQGIVIKNGEIIMLKVS